MDPAAGLRLRHPLHPVHAAFVLQTGIGALTVDHKGNLFKTAVSVLIEADQFRLPAVGFRIFHIHPVNVRGKQRSLVPAGSAPDLYDDVFIVVWVFRQQQYLQLMLQLLDAFFGRRQLFL